MKDLLDARAYDYALPRDRIAATPAETRSGSRLLHLSGSGLVDRTFSDLPDLLRAGDLLVVNDARVSPVRLHGTRASGGRVEVFAVGFGHEGQWSDAAAPLVAMIRSNRRVAPGEVLDLSGVAVEVLARDGKLARCRVVDGDAWELLDGRGAVPLPPYVVKRRAELDTPAEDLDDGERYQTVFARAPGAVAAPTAGLHFDQGVLDGLAARGVGLTTVTLHVGIGTFAPVQTERLDEHAMHTEHYTVPNETAERIADTRAAGGRIVAIGTTVVRTLESASDGGEVRAGVGATELFIRPGYRFSVVDGLVTNFHLPRSTLLALVSAFCGYDETFSAYRHAVASGYRFYSYGDAMFAFRRQDG